MDNITIEITDNYSLGKTIKCYCNKCRKEINHAVIKSIREDWEKNEEYGPYGHSDYQTIKCLGCDSITFRKYSFFSEYADQDSNGTWEELFPESIAQQREVKEYESLPYNLETVYSESIKCFNNRQYILCATGIRSILEGICIERGIDKGIIEIENKDGRIEKKSNSNLIGKINGLNQNGIITVIQMDALHELRFLGNNAVHELEIPTRKDLMIAFDIIEHMLSDIYDLPIKSKKLGSKRKK